MKNKVGVLIAVTVLAINILAGCGSTSDVATEAAATDTFEASIYEEESVPTESWETEEFADSGEDEQIDVSDTKKNRKLITTMNLNVETTEFDIFLQNIEQKVEQLGGYIESINQWNGYRYDEKTDASRNASLTIRVPAEQLDGFIEVIDQHSNITNKVKSVEDVTLSYVDLESHKNALKSEEKRLLELLDQAQNLEEVLQIEEKLTDIRYRMESMESQLRTYDNQIHYSTLYLSITEVTRVTPPAPESTWDAIRTGFTENVHKVCSGLRDLGIGFVISLPIIFVVLVVFAIFGLLIYWLVRWLLKICDAADKKQKTMRTDYPLQNERLRNTNPNSTEEKNL